MYSIVCIIFLLLLVINVIQNSVQAQACGQNQEYLQCGSSCPTTCSDFSYPVRTDRFCTANCVRGCFCKRDYHRDNNGQCVLPQECCKGSHEKYIECGSACVETCQYRSKFCIHQCIPGCFCESYEYVRESNQTGSICVKRLQCPKHDRFAS
ncbi:unnamed protein product [Rotaria magnacalcarata]|uniref:TIL domain-containing protein n=1 Tax=Rotaria magnacalcarata TaxID=392030 RepID=A0A814XDD0_9BILA|nr:unnamed protein product [Rotaria magnacalcarata]CAF1393366.1 unnamed protein product [Rotaria magnacalcarata]CAF2060581.1 unnamed protein product [Rotaria magnacalcarata]CAF2092888.1 unnamed protein product [Rotaria magnacalcarata]CAF2124252.1 unnamed protein product [Rotaria magnacalcarata]